MRGITWLASYPKSGSTWVRLFLAAYRNGGVALMPNAMPSDLDASDVGDEHYSAVSSVSVEKLTRDALLQIRGAALLHIMRGAYVRPLVVKTHWQRCNFEHVEIFPPVFSERAVYVVRDPRDVAVSFSKWIQKDLDETIEIMANEKTKLDGVNVKPLFSYLGTWSQHVASWSGRADTLVVRYEDMLETPAEIFAGVLSHLGIRIDEPRVVRAAEAVTFERMSAAEERGKFIETPPEIGRFFRSGRAGAWRGELTGEQARRIEGVHGEWMRNMGYL